MAQTSLPIAGSMSHSATEMSADLFVVGDKLGPEENQSDTGQDRPFNTMHEIGHAIEAEADAENKLPLSEQQPDYTEMSVAEYEEQQPQTEIGPTPVADIDFTSAIPLYERQHESLYKLMMVQGLFYVLRLLIAGTEPTKASPPSRLRH